MLSDTTTPAGLQPTRREDGPEISVGSTGTVTVTAVACTPSLTDTEKVS